MEMKDHRVTSTMLSWAAKAAFMVFAVVLALAIVAMALVGSARARELIGSKELHARDSSQAGVARAFEQRAKARGRVDRLSIYVDRRSTASKVHLALYA